MKVLAGISVIGAIAIFQQGEIRDKVNSLYQNTSVSSLVTMFQFSHPNPVIAMTDAPVENLSMPVSLGETDWIRSDILSAIPWSGPERREVSKIAAVISDATPAPTGSATSKFLPIETKLADINGLGPIELMKSAAEGGQATKPSQLDLILSAIPAPDKEETFEVATMAKVEDNLSPAPSDKLVEPDAAINTSLNSLRPVQRPAAPQQNETKEMKEPTYSAKHYHNLRFHLSGTKKKKSEIACIAELQLIASYTQIYFDSGSSLLDMRGASAARQIAAKAQSCPEARVSIIGFTDPLGTKEVNQRISWSRANGVFQAISEAGFSLDNFEVSSHMEDHPDYCVHFDGIDRRVVFDVHEKPTK